MRNATQGTTRFWAYLALGVAAAVLVASHTPVGAALSMDSLFYLSTASNILDGNGISHDTYALSGPAVQATTIWPPLYSVLLAALSWLANQAGIAQVVAIAVLNFVALGACLFLILRIASLTGSIGAGVVAAMALAISPSLQIVFTYAWSEVLFIPLCLGAYLSLQHHLMDNGSRQRLGLYSLVLLLGFATYTRYVGLAFFFAAALALLLYGRGAPIDRLRTVAAASLAYLAILAPMLIRNFAVSGSLSGGDRGAPGTSLLSDVETLGRYLNLELLNLPILPAAAVVLITVASVAWLALRPSDANPRAKLSFRSPNIVVPFLFAACYLVFLLIARGRQTIDLDSRMLSVAVPFIFLALLGVYQQLSIKSRGGLAALPFLLPLCAFTINAIYTHTSILKGWRDDAEPGPVLGLTYRSTTGRQMDSLRKINEYFSPAAGDLVLTDIARPMIVAHMFPKSDVRQMPDSASEESFAQLDAPLGRRGIAIISTESWSRALAEDLEGRAGFYRIESQTSSPEFIVIKLPVEAP